MKLLADLVREQYGIGRCERIVGPAACATIDKLTETFVCESGLWLLREVCQLCRKEALSHPIGSWHNGLSLPLTTPKLEV
jgi:hypothetical protein